MTTAQASVNKQLKNDAASNLLANNMDNIKGSMNTMIVIQMVLNTVMSGSNTALIGTLHVLQIICFQVMMNLKFPGNAAFLANQIISILNADILDPSIVFNIL